MEHVILAALFFITPIPWLVLAALFGRGKSIQDRLMLMGAGVIGGLVVFGPIVRDHYL
jgi:hypothetical protein